MILIVTFRIPGGVIGASVGVRAFTRKSHLNCAIGHLLASRVCRRRTLYSGRSQVFGFDSRNALLLGRMQSVHRLLPVAHVGQFGMATGLALVVSNVIGIWYLPGPAREM